jgi:hypothetical protein
VIFEFILLYTGTGKILYSFSLPFCCLYHFDSHGHQIYFISSFPQSCVCYQSDSIPLLHSVASQIHHILLATYCLLCIRIPINVCPKVATAVFAKMLDNFQKVTRLIPESLSCSLYSSCGIINTRFHCILL